MMEIMLLFRIIALVTLSNHIVHVTPTDLILHSDLNKKNSVEEKDSNVKVIYEATRSVCYTKGQAVECSPPFTNIAENSEIKATSTCGEHGQPEQVCRYTMGNTKCEVCNTADKFGTHLLTDRHQMNNETCWISGSVQPGNTVNLTLSLGKRFEVYYISLQPCGQLPDSIALYKSSDFGVTWRPWQYFSTDCYRAFRLPTSNEHNAQISLANIQEVLCVALKSSEIHDSSGQSSNVIVFSTTIGRPSTQPWSSALIDWMTMTDLRISLMRFPDHRDDIQHDSNGLFLNPSMLKPSKMFHVGGGVGNGGSYGGLNINHILSETGTLDMSQHRYQSDQHYSKLPSGKTGVHFAFSDLSVGGRCKCNGHSNRCVRDKITDTTSSAANNKDNNGQVKSHWGPLRCDCHHNTEGTDCERCSPGYLDRPWARGTSESANECKPCQCGNHTNQCVFSVKAFKRSGGKTGGVCVACQHHTEGPNCDQCITGYYRDLKLPIGNEQACRGCDCNLHSNSCIFSNQLYLMSMKVSGGVCQDCQHNTVGRRCHNCATGYYRDWTKPVSHDQVCLECRCHPIGSVPNQHCDRKTGQCPCKPGVIGQACNRCQDGYKQTRLHDAPCIKATEHYAYRRKESDQTSLPVKSEQMKPEPSPKCPSCEKSKKRIRFKKFCRCEAVFRGIIKSREIHGDLMRLEVGIQNTWRIIGAAEHLLPKTASPNLPAYRVWVRLKTNPTDKRHTRCACPNLQVGQSYLFITRSHQIPYGDRMELLLDTHSVILPWRESWRRRLMKFVRRAARESCDTNNVDNNEELKRTRRVQRLRLATDYYGLNNPLGQQNRIKSPSMPYQPEKMRSSTKILSSVRPIKQPSASNLHNSRDANVYYPSDKDASHHAAYQNIFSSFYSNQ